MVHAPPPVVIDVLPSAAAAGLKHVLQSIAIHMQSIAIKGRHDGPLAEREQHRPGDPDATSGRGRYDQANENAHRLDGQISAELARRGSVDMGAGAARSSRHPEEDALNGVH